MDPLWEQVARVLVAALPAVVALAGVTSGQDRSRRRLRHDVELVEKVPDGSVAREALLNSIARQVERIESLESSASRNIPFMALCLALAPLLGYLSIYLIGRDNWIGYIGAVVTGALALVFLFGIFDAAENVPRDSKKNRLRPTPSEG